MAGNFTKDRNKGVVYFYLQVSGLLTDKEVLDLVRKSEEQQQGDEEDKRDDTEPPPNIKQALDAAKLLEKYFLYHKMDPSVSQHMNKICRKVQKNTFAAKNRPTKIRDYTQ